VFIMSLEKVTKFDLNVQSMLRDMCRHTSEAIRGVGLAVDCWLDRDEQGLEEVQAAIYSSEQDAGVIMSEIIEVLSAVSNVNDFRRETLAIITTIDRVADLARSATFFLGTFYDWEPPEQIKDLLIEMINSVVDISDKLLKLMSAIVNRSALQLNYVEDIRQAESKIDQIYRDLVIEGLTIGRTEILRFLQLREFYERIEEIADEIERAAILIRALIISEI
jgi:predicted phosphate transport protein (TIGR00153 family)